MTSIHTRLSSKQVYKPSRWVWSLVTWPRPNQALLKVPTCMLRLQIYVSWGWTPLISSTIYILASWSVTYRFLPQVGLTLLVSTKNSHSLKAIKNTVWISQYWKMLLMKRRNPSRWNSLLNMHLLTSLWIGAPSVLVIQVGWLGGREGGRMDGWMNE